MNIKNGFSLAELLLVLAIIGIVTVMGITTMNIQTDRAYNIYYRQVYISLYNALSDAIANEYLTCSEIVNHASILFVEQGNNYEVDPLIEQQDINFLENEEIPNNNAVGTTSSITALNNVKLDMSYNNNDQEACQYMHIDATVPKRKTRNNPNGVETVSFHYLPQTLGGLLIPETEKLLTHKELLPFYIDDGIVGRRNGDRSPIQFMSYQDAFCNADLYSRYSTEFNQNGYITCASTGNQKGIIKYKKLKNNS